MYDFSNSTAGEIAFVAGGLTFGVPTTILGAVLFIDYALHCKDPKEMWTVRLYGALQNKIGNALTNCGASLFPCLHNNNQNPINYSIDEETNDLLGVSNENYTPPANLNIDGSHQV